MLLPCVYAFPVELIFVLGFTLKSCYRFFICIAETSSFIDGLGTEDKGFGWSLKLKTWAPLVGLFLSSGTELSWRLINLAYPDFFGVC